jgi:hypothetical protein
MLNICVCTSLAHPALCTIRSIKQIAQSNCQASLMLSTTALLAVPDLMQVISDWVTTAPVGKQRSNLDMLITLFDTAGTTIATINPPGTSTTNGLGAAAVSINLPAAGTYYISVSGSGPGGASTGYTSYGSLGQFGITVTYPAAAPPPGVSPSPSPPAVAPSPSPSPVPPPSPSPSPRYLTELLTCS